MTEDTLQDESEVVEWAIHENHHVGVKRNSTLKDGGEKSPLRGES